MLQPFQHSPAQQKEKVKQNASWKAPRRAGRQGQEEPLAGLLPAQRLPQAPRPRQSLGRRLQQGLVKQHGLFLVFSLNISHAPAFIPHGDTWCDFQAWVTSILLLQVAQINFPEVFLVCFLKRTVK